MKAIIYYIFAFLIFEFLKYQTSILETTSNIRPFDLSPKSVLTDIGFIFFMVGIFHYFYRKSNPVLETTIDKTSLSNKILFIAHMAIPTLSMMIIVFKIINQSKPPYIFEQSRFIIALLPFILGLLFFPFYIYNLYQMRAFTNTAKCIVYIPKSVIFIMMLCWTSAIFNYLDYLTFIFLLVHYFFQ